MRKNLLEWNAYIALTEKKIKKIEKELENESFIVVTKTDYALTKESIDKRVEAIKENKESLDALRSNVALVKAVRQYVNATNYIEVAGESMTVSTAIDRYLKRDEKRKYIDSLEKALSNLKYKEERALSIYTSEKESIERETATMNRPATEKEKEYNKERIEGYEPCTFDPLNLDKLLRNETEKFENFLSEVNVKLNVFNATTEMEVDL